MNAPAIIARPDLSPEQVVTSSDLVRHFGIWQDRASRAPVYVLQRGRPRFVLTTIDVMEAIPTSLRDAAAPASLDSIMIDAVSDLLIVADADLIIRVSNFAARCYFGSAAMAGSSIEGLAADDAGGILSWAAHRVAESGVPETLELPSPTYRSRALAVTIAPHGGGVTLVARDATVASDLAEARAQDEAQRQALAALQDVAVARLNLRGYVEDADASLAAMTGLPPESLARIRLVNLLDIPTRVAVDAAIEAVIADGAPQPVEATLLVNRGAPIPIRIGLAAIRQGAAVRGLIAMIARAEPRTATS